MKRYSAFISLIIVIVTVYYSFYSLMPQSISDTSTPLTEFSTERALLPLKELSKKPHYVGTEEHQRVQDFIVSELKKLGLTVTVQEEVIFRKRRGTKARYSGTKARNIIAKIEGTNNSKALILVSHYDSALNSAIGTSDAASGVVTILEGVRAYLAAGKQPKNDVIILITDAEELGLLGARAFAKKHSLAKDIGCVLNFEARGSGGPSYVILETNGGNKNLVEQLQKANPEYPVATSLMYSIYKMLPNDMDLTVFREQLDVVGFNFAFIGDHFDYHSIQDNFERIDRKTLEHQGTYIMPLLHYFADANLENLKSKENHVFFNFPVVGMIYYPFSWITPILLLVVVMFLGLMSYGVHKKKINVKEVLKGFIPFYGVLLVSGVLAIYGWELLKLIHPSYNDIKQGFTYNGYIYIAAFSSLSLGLCFLFYKKMFTKHNPINLVIAPVFVWILINVGAALYLEGAAFFILPAVYGLISLALLMFLKITEHNKLLVNTVLSIPILIIFTPNIINMPVGLGLKALIASAFVIVLLFGLFIPIVSQYRNLKLGRVFLGLSVIAFILASFQSTYTTDRKKPTSISYTLNADENKASWWSSNFTSDVFIQQFFGDTQRGKYGFEKETTVEQIAQPLVTIKTDTIIGNLRYFDFDIKTQRNAKVISLSGKNDFIVQSMNVNGFEMKKQLGKEYVYNTKNNKFLFNYNFAYNDFIINIKFSVPKKEVPKIILRETAFDLFTNPNFEIEPRADYMIPDPFVRENDAIILKKTINFTAD